MTQVWFGFKHCLPFFLFKREIALVFEVNELAVDYFVYNKKCDEQNMNRLFIKVYTVFKGSLI